MTGRLVLMGSGETTPTMVTPHQRIAEASGPGARIFLDTPYGFQENADELGEKIQAYFSHNVGAPVEAVSMRSVEEIAPARLEAVHIAVRDAGWLFAGPGSPSYVERQWREAGIGALLRGRVEDGRTVVLASAAACVAGTRTIPVYEVYKAGFTPWWLEGFDLLGPLGLRAVVVPHWDNAEGGTHDTSRCYLGERRLRGLEQELDPDEWVLGVDEHTALEIDLGSGACVIHGKGGVTVRVRGREQRWVAGAEVSVDGLRAAAGALGADRQQGPVAEPASSGVGHETTSARELLIEALARGDAEAATAVVIDAAPGDRGDLRELIARLGAEVGRGVRDPRGVVAPHVETLLHVRDRLREKREFDEADHIRGHLTADGVEVRDTPDGATWDLLEGN